MSLKEIGKKKKILFLIGINFQDKIKLMPKFKPKNLSGAEKKIEHNY